MHIPARLSVSAILIGLALLSHSVTARTYTFDPSMLGEYGADADVSLFNEGAQLPGNYIVDIVLNGERVDTRDVVFSLRQENDRRVLYPCLGVSDLSRYGVRTEDFHSLDDGSGCAVLSALPGTTYDFSFGEQQLRLSVPQVHLRPVSRGIAPQSLWDDGIPAFLMNYSASTSRTELRDSGRHYDSAFVQLNPGLNAGPWRLRSQSNWKKQGLDSGRWQTAYTYAERGIRSLRSTLTLGDRSTDDPVFNGIPFRGVMLASDESMVPYTERAFAPVIRGIARTQARVEIRQNAYLLYETTVAPGPFALRDLPLGGSWGGDLQVTVRESDGNVQTFSLPYQTPAVSLKEGYMSYGLMAGQYRPASSQTENSPVGQGVLLYGLPHELTVYSGVQSAKAYFAATLGMGISLGRWGATSVDVTGTRAQLREQDTEKGRAWRARYSKVITETGTTFTVAGYRHATPGFVTLEETLNSYRSSYSDTALTDNNIWFNRKAGRVRSTTSASLSQTMGYLGNLGINYASTNYWHHGSQDNSYGLAYGIGLPGGISLSLSQSRTRNTPPGSSSRNESMTSVWLSMPLGRNTHNPVTASYQGVTARQRETHSLGLNGTAFERSMTWDIRQAQTRADGTGSASNSYLRLGWNGTYGHTGTSYSYSAQQRTISADINGGMLLHENGMTFGQSIPGTIALVEAPGAAGVKVIGASGVRTDFRGYALQSSVTPYQENVVSLDPLELPDDVDITQTDVRVVPTRGAVVPARFSTRQGARAMMSLTREDGSAVPFGSLVTVAGAEGSAGIAGSRGQVYLTGLPAKGELIVRWGAGQCRATYILPAGQERSGVKHMQATCR